MTTPRLGLAVVAAGAVLLAPGDRDVAGTPDGNAPPPVAASGHDGRAVVAAFARRSYAPGEQARLRLFGRYPGLQGDVLHVGPEHDLTIGNETMAGVRVAELRVSRAPRIISLRIGEWASGVYAVRLRSGSRIGFAPFVVRPRVLGRSRVAVVQPTHTWQAYNRRRTLGRPGTWYGARGVRSVDLSRPFLSRGVPPNFRRYDLTFLRWLAHTGRRVDMLAQEDLERLSGDRLAQLYRLVVFPGHHEYVTKREYDAVERYRDLGGNLAFLSANNFFWRVRRDGDTITRVARWRDVGRPEAALVGVQFFEWDRRGIGTAPYTIRGVRQAPWLFTGTGLADGSAVGAFGVEADRRSSASPSSVRVLARIDNVFRTGHPAEMTYYETSRGARVFAAGAFTLAGPQLRQPALWRLLTNLWSHLIELDR